MFFVSKYNLQKTSKHGLVFLIFLLFCSFFFSAFRKIEGFYFFRMHFFRFFFLFVNPVQRCPLLVHKLTSRTSVGVEDWSSSSRPFPLGPLWVCCCCCCCCRPSRRLLSSTRSICSWHSFRTSCNTHTNELKFYNLQLFKSLSPNSVKVLWCTRQFGCSCLKRSASSSPEEIAEDHQKVLIWSQRRSVAESSAT